MITPNPSSIVSLDKVDFYVTISSNPGTNLPAAIDSVRLDIIPMLGGLNAPNTILTTKLTLFEGIVPDPGIGFNLVSQVRYGLVSLDSSQLAGLLKNRVAGPLLCTIIV
jgi:hypothetical protein